MRKLIISGILLTIAFAVTACNTVQGVGRDIESGGRSIERSAR